MQRRRSAIDRDRTWLGLVGRGCLGPALAGGMAGWLAGCAYQPGSFDYGRSTFPGERATVGCLDVAVERRVDLPVGPVLGYQFANRCDHALTIDLAALAVIGRNADGTEAVLRPHDPTHELHPVALDGRSAGGEAIAYPADHAVPQVCIDVATFAGQGGAQWRCFATASLATSGLALGAARSSAPPVPATSSAARSAP
jgi:hypothetical protein